MAKPENLPDMLRTRLERRRKMFRVVLASLGVTVTAAIVVFFLMARSTGPGGGARVLYAVAAPDDAAWLVEQQLPQGTQGGEDIGKFRVLHQQGEQLQVGPTLSGSAIAAARAGNDTLLVSTASRVLRFVRKDGSWAQAESTGLGLNDTSAWPVTAELGGNVWLIWLRGKSVLVRPLASPDAEPRQVFETASPATRIHSTTSSGAIWLTLLEGRTGQLTVLAFVPSLDDKGVVAVDVLRKSPFPGAVARSSIAVMGTDAATAVPVVAHMRKDDTTRTWSIAALVAGKSPEGEWVQVPVPPKTVAVGAIELTNYLVLSTHKAELHAWYSDGGDTKFTTAAWQNPTELRWSEPAKLAIDKSGGMDAMVWGGVLFGLALLMTSQFVWLILNRERPQDRAISGMLRGTDAARPAKAEPKLVYASGPARAMALLIDLAMTSPVVILLQGLYGYRWEDAYGFIVLVSLGSLETGILQVVGASLVTLCVLVMYSLFCELMWGKTLGKALFRLRVVDMEGETPSPWRVVVRNLLKIPEMIHWTVLIIPMALMLFSGRQQRLGDMAGGTLVVVDVIPDESPDDIDI